LEGSQCRVGPGWKTPRQRWCFQQQQRMVISNVLSSGTGKHCAACQEEEEHEEEHLKSSSTTLAGSSTKRANALLRRKTFSTLVPVLSAVLTVTMYQHLYMLLRQYSLAFPLGLMSCSRRCQCRTRHQC